MSTEQNALAEVRNFVYAAAQLPAQEAAMRLTNKLFEIAARYETSHRCRMHAESCLEAMTAERDALADLLKAGQRP